MKPLTLPEFKRAPSIEKVLDRAIFFGFRTTTSITSFMNILESEISYYNSHQQESQDNILNNILTKQPLNLNNLAVGTEHLEYIKELNRHIEDLKTKWQILPARLTTKQLYQLIISEIQNTNTFRTIEDLGCAIRETIQNKTKELITINTVEKNLRIWIPSRKFYFSLVPESHNYQHLESIYSLHLIIFEKQTESIDIERLRLMSRVTGITIKSNHEKLEPIESTQFYCIFAKDFTTIIKELSKLEEIPKTLIDSASDLLNSIFTVDYNLSDDPFDFKGAKNEAKALRNKLFNFKLDYKTLSDHRTVRQLFDLLRRVGLFLGNLLKKIEIEKDFESRLYLCLREIKQNNCLYIISKNMEKTDAIVYGEENLSAIIASNLRCLHATSININIECESWVGNGRSDVKISVGNTPIAIIESKLLREKSDIRQETINGIDQLYARYSENITITNSSHIGLYLVLFCYDKKTLTIDTKIRQAMHDYCEHNKLSHTKIAHTENTITYQLKEAVGISEFYAKTRTITICVCNLEIAYKSKQLDRTRIAFR